MRLQSSSRIIGKANRCSPEPRVMRSSLPLSSTKRPGAALEIFEWGAREKIVMFCGRPSTSRVRDPDVMTAATARRSPRPRGCARSRPRGGADANAFPACGVRRRVAQENDCCSSATPFPLALVARRAKGKQKQPREWRAPSVARERPAPRCWPRVSCGSSARNSFGGRPSSRAPRSRGTPRRGRPPRRQTAALSQLCAPA